MSFPEIERGELTRVRADALFPVVNELLMAGKCVEITVTGNSMYPTIRSLRDTAVLKAATFDEVGKLDIVLIRRASGRYVLHRVCKQKKDRIYIMGDRQDFLEEIDPAKDTVMAKAIAIRRGDRLIPCDRGKWLFFARIWIFLRPVRARLIALVGWLLPKVRRLFRFGKTPKGR